MEKFNPKKRRKKFQKFLNFFVKRKKKITRKEKNTNELLNFDLYDKMLTCHGALNPTSSIQRNMHATCHKACHSKSKFSRDQPLPSL